MTVSQIIDNDPTLKYLVKDAPIDWDNKHQIDLRFNALMIAICKYITNL